MPCPRSAVCFFILLAGHSTTWQLIAIMLRRALRYTVVRSGPESTTHCKTAARMLSHAIAVEDCTRHVYPCSAGCPFERPCVCSQFAMVRTYELGTASSRLRLRA